MYLSPEALIENIKLSVQRKQGMSVIRIGDGEAIWLGYPELYYDVFGESINEVIPSVGIPFEFDDVFPYAYALQHPARPLMLEAINNSVVGLPKADHIGYKWWKPVVDKLDITIRNYVTNNIHLELGMSNGFNRLLLSNKILYVTSENLTDHEKVFGLNGMNKLIQVPAQNAWDINDKVTGLLHSLDYDIALIGAGGMGEIWAYEAKKAGKVGIDMGSVLSAWAGKKIRSCYEQPPYDRIVNKRS